MSKYYELHNQKIRDRYGIEKFQVEPFNPHEKIDLTPNNGSESKHWLSYRKGLQDKFGIVNLELEGSAPTREKNLADIIREQNVAIQKNYKLATARATWRGQTFNVWFETGR